MRSPVVLIHGALGAAPQLAPLQARFGADRRAEIFELAGHGETAPTTDRFSIPEFVEQLRAFIKRRRIEPAQIFGYSMGGYIALALAAESPDLVSRVVTLATKFDWTVDGAAKEVARLDPKKICEKVPAFAAQLEERHRGAGGWVSVLARTAILMTELGAHPVVNGELLARIKCPVRVMVGDRDAMVTADESRRAADAANGEFVLLADTPHPMEQVNVDLLSTSLRTFFS